MQEILEAIQAGAPGDEIAALPIPESYRAAHVLRSEQDMWEGVPSEEKDPRKSLHVGEVPTPELAPDEVYLAVMASSINFNTVWTSIFEPLPTFGFLDRLGRESVWGARHALDHHVVGSDASGVVLRVGSAVRNWKPGDRVVVHCNYVDDQDPSADDMLPNQPFASSRTSVAWPSWRRQGQPAHAQARAPHLGEARSTGCALDQLRALGRHSRMKQRRRHLEPAHSLTPAALAARSFHRAPANEGHTSAKAEGYRFWKDGHTQDESEWRRLGKKVRELVGEDPDIVFEHPGRQTMGASVFIAKRGGTIVTCAATSGYMIEYDNRHLWMKLKRIVSSHFANYQEAWEMNRLIDKGAIHPVMSAVYPLDQVGEAARAVHRNEAEGKLAVLCLAPEPGQGVADPDKRERIGEERLTLFQRHARGEL